MSATGQATEAPSDAARELVRGAFDLHVHISPDVVERRIDDIGLARRFAELGLAGFVLKSHYNSTAERAAVVREAVPGVEVLGAIVLNRAVGGVNPVAVEIAAREGACTTSPSGSTRARKCCGRPTSFSITTWRSRRRPPSTPLPRGSSSTDSSPAETGSR